MHWKLKFGYIDGIVCLNLFGCWEFIAGLLSQINVSPGCCWNDEHIQKFFIGRIKGRKSVCGLYND